MRYIVIFGTFRDTNVHGIYGDRINGDRQKIRRIIQYWCDKSCSSVYIHTAHRGKKASNRLEIFVKLKRKSRTNHTLIFA